MEVPLPATIASTASHALTCSRMPSLDLCFHTKNMFFFASESPATGRPTLKPPLCLHMNFLACLRPRFKPTKTTCPKRDFASPDIEGFVKDFLIHEGEWSPGRAEKLNGFHIFVCAHASRDMRCGVCGPALLERFEREISSQGLDSFVFVRPCSHVGGHKYAGNVIIYGKDSNDSVTGHWYGYVTPSDVVTLLDEHISKGQIIHRLWRGKMGMAEQQ